MSAAASETTPLLSATTPSQGKDATATDKDSGAATPPLVVDTGFTAEEQEDIDEDTQVVKIFNRAFSGTANLANLLPTGSFLTFQILSPIVTNSGNCSASYPVFTILTCLLLSLCGLAAFLLSLTDSFQATNGKIYYGVVTTYGLWSPFVKGQRVENSKYAIKVLDVVHAILSLVVFGTSTLLTEYVRECLYPGVPTLVYNLVPVSVGFFISLFFVLYPTTRHGVGYPAVASIIQQGEAAK